jgi:hypothetical protein
MGKKALGLHPQYREAPREGFDRGDYSCIVSMNCFFP